MPNSEYTRSGHREVSTLVERQNVQNERSRNAAQYAAGSYFNRRGFTLLDVLTSLAVIAVLVSLTLPTLSKVRETTHRVVCSAHIRELLIGTEQWARDHKDELPPSEFAPKSGDQNFQPERMQTLRRGMPDSGWDGLGNLWQHDYGVSVASYYCPAHAGQHPMSRYVNAFTVGGTSEIIGNYHMRGFTGGNANLNRMNNRLALITDGLSSQVDFNHRVGGNVGRLDWSVAWYNDPSGEIVKRLPGNVGDAMARDQVELAWRQLDSSTAPLISSGTQANGPW
jgi:type II secretory pathway pseudopilin PulG